MITDQETVATATAYTNSAGPDVHRERRRFWVPPAAILLFTVLAVGIQIQTGSYQAEFSTYPDEAAHVVTGVALEQYVVHGLPHSPIAFFLDYYKHYPKVALGHWPPLLYVGEAGAMLIGGVNRFSLLGLQAVFAGILGWLLFRELRPLVGTVASILGAAALLLNRQIARLTSMAMAELLLTVTMFLACLSFARFAEQRRTRDAIWAGLWVSAAVLTKGIGWVVLIVPAAIVLVNRDWKFLRERGLWLAALMVAALCLPWQVLTLKMSAQGWPNHAGLSYTLFAVSRYSMMLAGLPGFVMTACAAIGMVRAFGGGREAGRSRAYWVALASMVVGLWIFLVLVPASVEARYLLAAVPPLFLLAALGSVQCARRIFRARRRESAGVIFAGVALITICFSLPVQPKARLGFGPAVSALDRVLPAQSAALVVSDVYGEGAVLSEAALRRPRPNFYIVRGSKLLSSQGWAGQGYRTRVTSADDCERLLASIPVQVLVMDRRSSKERASYSGVVERMLEKYSGEWHMAEELPMPDGSPGGVALYYRASGSSGPPVIPGDILPKLPH